MRNDSLARNEILFRVFGPEVQKVAHPCFKACVRQFIGYLYSFVFIYSPDYMANGAVNYAAHSYITKLSLRFFSQ